MSETKLSDEQLVEAVYAYAAEQMKAGLTRSEITKKLTEKGLDLESAMRVVRNLEQAKGNAVRSMGQKNMLYGALWCVGGIAVTALTYSMAAGGGRYVVAWGAVIFGGIQFVRGLVQAAGGE